MNARFLFPVLGFCSFTVMLLACGSSLRAAESGEVKRLFADPPREYSTGPLWVWNDRLTEDQIRSTLRDLAGQKVKQVWVHPRPGLMTPYLSDEWFGLWDVALDEAERLDMNVWIYDENSYPSGFAGGLVPEAMPESRGQGLGITEQQAPPKWSDKIVAVHRLTENGYELVTESVRNGSSLPKGRYIVSSLREAPSSGWFGGKFYVNLLRPGVTETFLELTMEPYRKRLGNQFGKRIPGVFTDEPHIQPAGGFPWTDGLPALFKARWGYSLLDHLPALTREVGDWKRVRHNYLQVLLEQFVEHWSKPYYNYCEKNHLEFTGHYWEHEWPNCLRAPDNMAMYAWHQRPAIDTLMNEYHEDTHAQFGNVRSVIELASVANQLGRSRTLCEAYGAGGWDLRLEDMKRIGDWLYVLGVNTLNQHLSYVTIRGARKRDHPQSFSYHTPWWEAYHVSAAYFARLSVALSSGRQVNDILLIEPTTTAWMYNGAKESRKKLDAIGTRFQSLVVDLAKAQVEFDLGSEDVMARNGSVAGDSLRVGRRAYKTVVIPPMTENLNETTAKLLDEYLDKGGTVLCAGKAPAWVDGRSSTRMASVSKKPGWKKVEPGDLISLLGKRDGEGLSVRRNPGDGILFHHRRRLDDGDLLFLVNSSIKVGCTGSIDAAAGSVEQWDPYTGSVSPYPFETVGKKTIRTRFELPPSGSLVLFLPKERRTEPFQVTQRVTTIKPTRVGAIQRIEPNVLVLDHVDVTAGGQTKKNIYVYQGSQFVFQKNGMSANPWDSAVQLRDEFIKKTFPADSGFEAVYRFVIDGPLPKPLWAVIERADLYTITVNGKPVSAKKGAWWLDKAFGKIDIGGAVSTGENELRISASPFTIYHELESAYILGPFRLAPAKKGFVVKPDAPLKHGPWNKQGNPLYAAGVRYEQTFDLSTLSGRYRVKLGAWYGSAAKVLVNGKPAGYVDAPPWTCDVTDSLNAGRNAVAVVVIGTLKNTLGPHHGNPALGKAWPGSFHKAPAGGLPPGEAYSTVGYGLFEPFVIERIQKTETKQPKHKRNQ